MVLDSIATRNPNFVLDAGGICDPGDSHEDDVILYAKTEGRKEHVALDTLSYSSYKVCLPTFEPSGPFQTSPDNPERRLPTPCPMQRMDLTGIQEVVGYLRKKK